MSVTVADLLKSLEGKNEKDTVSIFAKSFTYGIDENGTTTVSGEYMIRVEPFKEAVVEEKVEEVGSVEEGSENTSDATTEVVADAPVSE